MPGKKRARPLSELGAPAPPNCPKCGRELVSCLWDGVQGWLCAPCAVFQKAKAT